MVDSSIQMVNAQIWEVLVIHKGIYAIRIPDNWDFAESLLKEFHII